MKEGPQVTTNVSPDEMYVVMDRKLYVALMAQNPTILITVDDDDAVNICFANTTPIGAQEILKVTLQRLERSRN